MDSQKKITNYFKTKSLILIAILAFTGLMGYVKFYFIPSSVTTLIETMSESYGLDISVDDLTTDIMDFSVSLEDISWKVRGRYSSSELFKADRISFDVSLINFLSNGFNLGRAIHEVFIEDAQLHIEHKNSKRWNWEDAFNGKKILRYVNKNQQKEIKLINTSTNDPEETEDLFSGSHFSLASLNFNGLKIVWVEELPSNSGGGTIIRSRSELYIDDASLIVKNIIGLFQLNPQPMEIDFDGRTADGIIQTSGEINLFSWSSQTSNDASGAFIPVSSNRAQNTLSWAPTFELDFYLENVGAAAFGQMVPDSAIYATKGSMTGNIKVALDLDQTYFFNTDNLELVDMSWEINKNSSINKGKSLKYAQRGLNKYSNKSMTIVTSSKGRIDDKDFKVFPSLQTAITREAVKDAPKSVKRIANNDQYRYEDKKISPYAQQHAKIVSTITRATALRNIPKPPINLPIKPRLPVRTPSLPSFGGFPSF